MNILAGIVIGLAVIGVVLYGAALALTALAEGVGDGCRSIVELLGRKGRNAKAVVPKELTDAGNPMPKVDLDKADFLKNPPTPFIIAAPAPTIFNTRIDRLTAPLAEPTDEIDIGSIGSLLDMTSFITYEPLLSSLLEKHAYPVAAPQKPGSIPPPPIWTPWMPKLGDPSFAPPHYSSWLSFLNGFVDNAHKSEVDKFNNAIARKDEILADCSTRNKEIESLAEKAKVDHQKANARLDAAFASATMQYEKDKKTFENANAVEISKAQGVLETLARPADAGLLARIDLALRMAELPSFVSMEGKSRFDETSGILIHEHKFPDLSEIRWVKQIELKSGAVKKPANQKECKEAAAKIYPSLTLRLAAETIRLDTDGIVKGVAINGWADYTEKSTGQRKRAYCASLFANKEQIASLNISSLDPVAAFSSLKGMAAHSLEITPIAPILRLDMTDPRFVDAKEILAKMAEGENLAAMDWEDFEHLCRELFERAFTGSGAEVKVTQASRDQGVDAVIFDPDPLRGGKIIVQAKRYTNTVDVSVVRDLYGAVINEGATKGILVTTSHYGPESYSFAKDKPLTLLNGRELLGLLEKHGYKFRINLAEAKGML